MQRYAENNRLLNDFYATDPSEKEREELRSQVAELKNELAKKNNKEENEEERQLSLMEKSYQMAAKYLPKSTPNNPTALNNAFAQAQERTIVASSSDKQSEGTKAVEVLPERPRNSDLIRSRETTSDISILRKIDCSPLAMLSSCKLVLSASVVRPLMRSFSLSH